MRQQLIDAYLGILRKEGFKLTAWAIDWAAEKTDDDMREMSQQELKVYLNQLRRARVPRYATL